MMSLIIRKIIFETGLVLDFGQQMVHLLPFAVVLWNSKIKAKPGGRAPRLRLTLLLAQKSKQKKACAALGMSGASVRQPQPGSF